MVRKDKYVNLAIIVSNIVMLIDVILIFILNNNVVYSLYWLFILMIILANTFFIGKWTRDGNNIEKKQSKIIHRSVDDALMIATGIYYLSALVFMFIKEIKPEYSQNIYFIIALYILTIFYEGLIYLQVYGAKNETRKLIEKTYKKKK